MSFLLWGCVGMIMGTFLYRTKTTYDGMAMLYQYHYQKEKNMWRGLTQTVKAIAWIGYMFLYQKVSNNIEKKGRHEYDIHYVLANQLYKIRVKARRGPKRRKVLQVIDEHDNDVTVDVIPYLGPKEDWHGMIYQPHHMNYHQLTFNLTDGSTQQFERFQPIMLVEEIDIDTFLSKLD